MKVFEDKAVAWLSKISCDCCGVEADAAHPYFGGEDFLSFEDVGGYASAHGDGTAWSVDLCGPCTVKILGPYIRKEEP